MTITSFDALKIELCRLLNMPDAPPAGASVAGGGDAFSLWIDDVPVILCHFPGVRADRVFLMCDYGEVPEESELLVLRHAMEKNFLMYRGNASTYARDPLLGTLVLLGEIDLGAATPESALRLVRDFAASALAFRTHHFKDERLDDDKGLQGTEAWRSPGGLA